MREKMPVVSIRFSGFGGQGIVLSAITLASGAVIHEGKSAIQTQSYGPESRGGASKAEVIISDRDVDYPLIDEADVLVALSQEALDKYLCETHEKSLVIIDPTFVREVPEAQRARVVEIPSASLADGVGNRMVMNMVVLGALAALTSVISPEALEKSVRDNTPPGFHEANLAAVRAGIKCALEIQGKES
jgi:2-oxoglutarate ferredoxin oxidoreductase subunit gamma